MRRKRVYLDYAATTPLDPKVFSAMLPYLKKEFGNPSSVHSYGQTARAAIEEARERVASFLSCKAGEIVFCGGATEANNLAIQGTVQSAAKQPHVIVSVIEHESVIEPVRELEKRGDITVTYIFPNTGGVVNFQDIEKAIKKNTALVSIQYANSEIGTIQPISQIAKIIRKKNPKTMFHTDAVQAALSLDCDVRRLGVDLLTLSAHKMYGPKGVGALYVREAALLSPLLYGGGQEQGMRSGTENVAGIVGMGAAVLEVSNPRTAISSVRVRQLRDRLLKRLLQKVPEFQVHGSLTERLPSNINGRVPGILGADLVFALDQRGFAISTGSACTERSQEPSAVIQALGIPKQEAQGAIRVTLGKQLTADDGEKFVKAFASAISFLKNAKKNMI